MDVTQGVVGQSSKKDFNANPLLLIILRTATKLGGVSYTIE
jgi:hypothetical protein